MKKFFACILILAVAFSGMTVFSQETSEAARDEKYIEACTVLSALGIMQTDDSNFMLNVKRGEFASVVCKMYPVIAGGQLESGETLLFRDVTEASPYYSDIVSVFAAGIMIGKTNRHFGAEDNVTLNEAVKVLTSLLGYEPMSSVKGGVFTGYNTIAKETGLLNGISLIGNAELTNEVLAQLILNTMQTEFMNISSVGSNSVSYAPGAGTTILNNVYNVYKTIGQITAVDETDIYGTADSAPGQIEIDRGVYNLSENVVIEYSDLGVPGVFYINKTETDIFGNVIYFAPNEGKYRKLVFDEENYSEYDEVKISNSANVVYNGAYLGIYSTAGTGRMKPQYGNVTLVDSDNDRVYDVVVIRNIAYRVVNSTNYTLGQAILGLGGTIKNKGVISGTDEDITIYKDGRRVNMEYVGKGDLLEVEENLSNSKVRITVVTDYETALITGLSNKKITLDETEYDRYKNILLYDSLGNTVSDISVNLDGTFYRDSTGKVCLAVIDTKSGWQHGFLYQAAIKSGAFAEAGINCRILTKTNNWLEAETDTKVIIDGSTTANYQTLLDNWKNGSDYVGKICKYKINSKGLITALDVASDTKESDNDNNSLYKAASLQNFKVDHTWGYNFAISGGNPYKIMDTTALLNLPNDLSDENYIKFILNTDIVSLQTYDIVFYSPDEMYVCEAATISSPGGEAVSDSSFSNGVFIVNELSSKVDEDGDVTTEVSGFEVMSNQIYEKSYLINYEALSKNTLYSNTTDYSNAVLEKGIVFRFMVNGKNELTKVRIVFSCYNKPASYFMRNSGYTNETVYGEVTAKDMARNLYMLKCTDDPSTFVSTTAYAYKSYRPRAVAVFDSATDEIRPATIGEADVGNKVFAWGNYGHPLLTFIMK